MVYMLYTLMHMSNSIQVFIYIFLHLPGTTMWPLPTQVLTLCTNHSTPAISSAHSLYKPFNPCQLWCSFFVQTIQPLPTLVLILCTNHSTPTNSGAHSLYKPFNPYQLWCSLFVQTIQPLPTLVLTLCTNHSTPTNSGAHSLYKPFNPCQLQCSLFVQTIPAKPKINPFSARECAAGTISFQGRQKGDQTAVASHPQSLCME